MSSTEELIGLLKLRGLRDTVPRRGVLDACLALDKPVSPKDVFHWLHTRKRTIDLVTIYRILEKLETLGLVHRHACNGDVALCSMPEKEGHHAFLHCSRCGHTREFVSASLCRTENAIAQRLEFTPSQHVSEIVGTCRSCTRSPRTS